MNETIKNQGIQFLVTFVTLLIGLPLIGTEHWGLFAFLVALCDIVPVIGASAFMLIWDFCVLNNTQDMTRGYWLILLYIIVMIEQQILLPFFPRHPDLGVSPFEMVLATTVGYLVTALQPVGILIGPAVYLLGKKIVFTFMIPRNTKNAPHGYFNRGFSFHH